MEASFECPLNDASVEVVYTYPAGEPAYAELVQVLFCDVDIYDTMHPEDQARLVSMVCGKAEEHAVDERAEALDRQREARYEDQ